MSFSNDKQTTKEEHLANYIKTFVALEDAMEPFKEQRKVKLHPRRLRSSRASSMLASAPGAAARVAGATAAAAESSSNLQRAVSAALFTHPSGRVALQVRGCGLPLNSPVPTPDLCCVVWSCGVSLLL